MPAAASIHSHVTIVASSGCCCLQCLIPLQHIRIKSCFFKLPNILHVADSGTDRSESGSGSQGEVGSKDLGFNAKPAAAQGSLLPL